MKIAIAIGVVLYIGTWVVIYALCKVASEADRYYDVSGDEEEYK